MASTSTGRQTFGRGRRPDQRRATHTGFCSRNTFSILRALSSTFCAVEVQRGMAAENGDVPKEIRIEFRIGIHLGDIIIDNNDIFGDGVNIAARLEGIAEAGGVCISDDVQRQIRGKVDIAFDDMGPQILKNIAEPMRAWRSHLGDGAASKLKLSSSPTLQSQGLALPDKPSIAVLPFQNMSSDPEQEYLADGMTEDIITLLSQTRDFLVIARSSTFGYKAKTVDLTGIGPQLGVRYVLEGSVRRSGNRIRVTAQLVEARTANRIWADHFDGDLTDFFAVQDAVTRGIVGALHPQLFSADAQSYRRQPPNSLDAWGLVVRGMMALISFTKENLDEAVDLASRAIAIAPDFGLAYGVRAFALNTNSSDNYLYMAAALAELGETERARKQIERALRIVPKLTLKVIARGIPDGTGWERYHAGLRKAGLPE